MVLIPKFLFILFLTFSFLPVQVWQVLNYYNKSASLQPKSILSHEKKRQQILRNLEKVMGKLPDRSDLPPFDIKISDSLKEDRYTR